MTLTALLAAAVAEDHNLPGNHGAKAALKAALASDALLKAEADMVLQAAVQPILDKDHITRIRVKLLKEAMANG